MMLLWIPLGLVALLCSSPASCFAAAKMPQYKSKLALGHVQTKIFSADSSVVAANNVINNDEGVSSVSTSTFNLAKSIVGAGVLSLPSGVAFLASDKTALLPSTVICAVFGLAAAYTFSSIGKVCKETNAKTFQEAWDRSVDERSGWFISTSITAMCFLASLAYSIIIGDSFTSLAKTFHLPGLLSERNNVILALSSLVLLPLAAMKSLAALAPFSLLGLGGILYTAVFMAIRLVDRSYLPGGRFFASIAHKPLFTSAGFSLFDPKAFVLLSMLSTSYIAHYGAPKFYAELRHKARFGAVVNSAFAAAVAFFAFIMAVGFLTFGGATQGFVLNNYASADQLATVARCAVGLALLTSYPFTFSALRDGLMDLMRLSPARRSALFLPLTVGLLGLVTALALALTDVGFVVSITGALLGNLLMFIVPAIMNISLLKKTARRTNKPLTSGQNAEIAVNYALMSTGAVMTVLGVYVSVMKQLGKL